MKEAGVKNIDFFAGNIYVRINTSIDLKIICDFTTTRNKVTEIYIMRLLTFRRRTINNAAPYISSRAFASSAIAWASISSKIPNDPSQ